MFNILINPAEGGPGQGVREGWRGRGPHPEKVGAEESEAQNFALVSPPVSIFALVFALGGSSRGIVAAGRDHGLFNLCVLGFSGVIL